jgi:hypothetical protein
MTVVVTPMIPVRFVYLGPDGAELDRHFDALCVSVPRVGESVELVPRGSAVVHRIYNRFVVAPDDPEAMPMQYVTVVLKDAA